MKQLFTIDLKDYNPNGKKYYRPSVRGIIFDDKGNIENIIEVKEYLLIHIYCIKGQKKLWQNYLKKIIIKII